MRGLEAVVAVYADWGIGRGGTQPVVVRADRKHFRQVTGDGAVIVGRKTLADFPGGRPLKGRTNIVLTRQALEIPGATVVHAPEEALAAAEGREPCFVIGGESVYRQMFPWIRRVYVTELDACPESDSFFPDLSADPEWALTDAEDWQEENGIRYRFCTYDRRKAEK